LSKDDTLNTISLVSGFIAGIIYGLFFLYSGRRAFSLGGSEPLTSRQKATVIGRAVLFIVVGKLLLIVFLAYLLRSYKINGIYFIISFLVAFWFIISNTKAFLHDKC
jgi:hypothetical protein